MHTLAPDFSPHKTRPRTSAAAAALKKVAPTLLGTLVAVHGRRLGGGWATKGCRKLSGRHVVVVDQVNQETVPRVVSFLLLLRYDTYSTEPVTPPGTDGVPCVPRGMV